MLNASNTKDITNIDFWTQINLIELLKKTGAKDTTLKALKQIFIECMCSHQAIARGRRTCSKRMDSPTGILLYELGCKDVYLLLTSVLNDVFKNDMLAAIPISNLFGNDICFMTDLLTRKKARNLSDRGYYSMILSRFNNASEDKEKKLMTIISIVLMADHIHMLRKNSKGSNCRNGAYWGQTDPILTEYLDIIDPNRIHGKFSQHFFSIIAVLMEQVSSAERVHYKGNNL